MKFKTEQTPVKAKVAVWAIPDRYNEDNLFNYACYCNPLEGFDEPYDEGAVRVVDREVTVVVPAGIDLVTKAIETLTEAKEVAKRRAEDEITEAIHKRDNKIDQLQVRIDELLQLPYYGAMDG